MTYDKFILEIKERAQERLGKFYTVALEKVLKNNGVTVDALCLNRKGEEIRPTLYLNVYYDLYQKEMPLDDIMDEILGVYEWNENHPSISPEEFRDFEKMKNRIIYKLINAERNSRRLKEVPHICYQDLAVVFCIYIESLGENFTSLIHSEHLNIWGITEQELYELAKKNTPLLLTAEIESIERVLIRNDKGGEGESREGDGYSEELNELLAENGDRLPMYVLSNNQTMFGASCIMYEGLLKGFSERMGCNLVILPSSIHEMIIMPEEEDTDFEELREMVRVINDTTVPDEDVLSNEIYYYSLENDTLSLISNGKTGIPS